MVLLLWPQWEKVIGSRQDGKTNCALECAEGKGIHLKHLQILSISYHLSQFWTHFIEFVSLNFDCHITLILRIGLVHVIFPRTFLSSGQINPMWGQSAQNERLGSPWPTFLLAVCALCYLTHHLQMLIKFMKQTARTHFVDVYNTWESWAGVSFFFFLFFFFWWFRPSPPTESRQDLPAFS